MTSICVRGLRGGSNGAALRGWGQKTDRPSVSLLLPGRETAVMAASEAVYEHEQVATGAMLPHTVKFGGANA